MYLLKEYMELQEYKKQQFKNNIELKRECESIRIERKLALEFATARTMQGLTQQQLAEKAGIRQSHLSRFESGKHIPSLEFVNKIAKALGKNLLWSNGDIDSVTGFQSRTLIMYGKAIILAQKLEKILSEIVYFDTKLKLRDFSEEVKVPYLSFGRIINEAKKEKIFKKKETIKQLEYLRDKRNWVTHECFNNLNLYEEKCSYIEKVVFERLRDIVDEFQKAENHFWHINKGLKNELDFQMAKYRVELEDGTN